MPRPRHHASSRDAADALARTAPLVGRWIERSARRARTASDRGPVPAPAGGRIGRCLGAELARRAAVSPAAVSQLVGGARDGRAARSAAAAGRPAAPAARAHGAGRSCRRARRGCCCRTGWPTWSRAAGPEADALVRLLAHVERGPRRDRAAAAAATARRIHGRRSTTREHGPRSAEHPTIRWPCRPSDHAHSHLHVEPDADSRRLTIALALIVALMVVEVVAGILADSLALLSDAAHMLTDAGGAGCSRSSSSASSAGRRAGNLTFGLRRAEMLSAQANGATLLVLAWADRLRGDPPADRPARAGRDGRARRRARRDRVNLLATRELARANRRLAEHPRLVSPPADRPVRVRRDRRRRADHHHRPGSIAPTASPRSWWRRSCCARRTGCFETRAACCSRPRPRASSVTRDRRGDCRLPPRRERPRPARLGGVVRASRRSRRTCSCGRATTATASAAGSSGCSSSASGSSTRPCRSTIREAEKLIAIERPQARLIR